jgi:hypothetical protein
LIYIRDPEGSVELARLDRRNLMAHWRKRWTDREVTVEWTLWLDGQPIAVRDKRTGAPAVVALHRWEEGGHTAREAVRRPDGVWEIEVPLSWHTMCAIFSGSLKLELDAAKLEILYSDDIHVEL